MVSDIADDSEMLRGPWLSGLLGMVTPPSEEGNGPPAVLETLWAQLAGALSDLT